MYSDGLYLKYNILSATIGCTRSTCNDLEFDTLLLCANIRLEISNKEGSLFPPPHL